MFGSEFLDIGIGVALLFLFVSLICTAAQEGLENLLKSRSKDLERGIRELLDDPDHAKGLVEKFYNHPLIHSLFRGKYDKNRLRDLPSYIPSANFAGAIIDLVSKDKLTGSARSILAAVDLTKGDLDSVKKDLEAWFDGTMDRVSGWYKRRTQKILFVIGLAVAIGLNIDAIEVIKALSTSKALQEAAVAQAEQILAAADEADQTEASEPSGVGVDAGEGAGAAAGDAAAGGQSGGGTAASGTTPAPDEEQVTETPATPTPTGVEAGTDPGAGAATDDTVATGQAGEGTAASEAPPADTAAEAVEDEEAEPQADPVLMALYRESYEELESRLKKVGYPIGWPGLQGRTCDAQGNCSYDVGLWVGVQAILGWLITALAILLGAPFWFDVLNKFMVIRSTVKPREKSQEEGSEDRQTGKNGPEVTVRVVPEAAGKDAG